MRKSIVIVGVIAVCSGLAAAGVAAELRPPPTQAAPALAASPPATPQLLPSAVPQPKPLPATSTLAVYRVTKVLDGDTIEVGVPDGTERVRLAGLNTAELAEGNLPTQCFALEAAAKVSADLLGKEVQLAPDPAQSDRDPKGRLLRYVGFADGTDYNSLLVAGGYAKEMTYHGPHSRQAAYQQAERAAEQSNLGFWSPSSCGGDLYRPAISLQRQTFAAAATRENGPPTCGSFVDQTTAQRYYEFRGGPFSDKFGLDPERNGRACEELPF